MLIKLQNKFGKKLGKATWQIWKQEMEWSNAKSGSAKVGRK